MNDEEARVTGDGSDGQDIPHPVTALGPLESEALDAVQRIEALKPPRQSFREARARNLFLTGLAVVVSGLVLALAGTQPELFGEDVTAPLVFVPFGAAFAGVLLYVMGSARKLRAEWRFGSYFGEYAFRVAQALTYLMVVWWAWNTGAAQDAGAADLPPNILGLFVGMFILHVERAMAALGERFEELLNSILPGSLRLRGPEERREHIKADAQVKEIEAQWKLLRPKISDLGARDRIDRAVEIARTLTGDSDSRRARQAGAELERLFEDVRANADGEEWVNLDTMLEGA